MLKIHIEADAATAQKLLELLQRIEFELEHEPPDVTKRVVVHDGSNAWPISFGPGPDTAEVSFEPAPPPTFILNTEPAVPAPEPVALVQRINDKQWSALLNMGISHGKGIDEITKLICSRYSVDSIKQLPANRFQEALDLLAGKTESPAASVVSTTPGTTEAAVPAFQAAAEAVKISSKQWTALLNAGCYVGLGVDGTEAFIKQKFGKKARELTNEQYDAALELVKNWTILIKVREE